MRPLGGFVTPLQADTIFGHLCWLVRWTEGEDDLKDFLASFESAPPFILSDGFPGDLLPAPCHLPTLIPEGLGEMATYDLRKSLKGIEWLTTADFNSVCKGRLVDSVPATRGFIPFSTLHSSINRITGTTGDEGSLYEIEEYATGDEHEYISIYVKMVEGLEDRISGLFRNLGLMGYGRKRSVGRGSMEFISMEPFDGFGGIAGANGFISLSNFVPAETDPTDGFYRTMVKYGKLGGEFTFCGNPFKRPLMMISAGSAFKTDKAPDAFYGTMVKDIAPQKPEVVHYGYAFAVPAILLRDKTLTKEVTP